MAVTYVHTSGRAVTVAESTRVARLLAEDANWTEQKSTSGGSRGTGDSKRRRSTSRKATDGGGDDES